MVRYNRSDIALAVLLSALGGYVDARGLLGIGSFVSFMSGNSTRFGIALCRGNLRQAAVIGGIIATFVIGVVLGSIVGHFAGRRRLPVILSLVALLLAIAAAAHHFSLWPVQFGAMILAMGAENTVFQKRGEVSIGLTYMTGTLVKMGQRIAGAILGRSKKDWLPYACLWLGMVGGAILGTAVGAHGVWFAAVFAAVLAIASSGTRARPTPLRPVRRRVRPGQSAGS